MGALKSAWEWLKKWGLALGGGLLALLGIGAGWLYQRKRLARVKDQAAVDKALGEMDALRMLRARVRSEEGAVSGQIEAIDRKLDENKRRIIGAHEGIEAVKDEDLDDTLARLGY